MASLSEGCMTKPAATTTEYSPKGKYEKVGELEVYITGDQSSTQAIINIYDAFGLRSQTIQGADLLAASVPCLVIMPDYFKGSPGDPNWYPTDTEEKAQLLQKFKTEKAFTPKNLPMVIHSVADAKLRWPSVQGWGVFGLCWGGKLAAQASGPGSPFKASGQAHPSQLAKEDAEKMSIPHICLASPGEAAEVVKQYANILGGEGKIGEVETYSSMFHGWMGARSNLQNAENLKEFERGYKQAARFFAEHL